MGALAAGTGNPTTTPLAADDGTQLLEAARYQFLSYLRTNRFLAMLILTVLVTVVICGIAVYFEGLSTGPGSTGSVDDFFATAFTFVALLIVLTGSFLGGDAVAIDFGSASGYFTLVLPIRRPILLLGRYLAAFATGLSLLVLQYAVLSLLAFHYYGTLSWELAESFGFATLYLLAILSLAFALGSFFQRPVVALVATILLVLFGFSIAQEAVVVAGSEPWMFATYAGGEITNIFSNSPHQQATPILTTWNPYPGEAASILVAYIVVGLALALFLHARKEVVG